MTTPTDRIEKAASKCECDWFVRWKDRLDVQSLGDDARCDLASRIAALVRRERYDAAREEMEACKCRHAKRNRRK